jgi:hypothetical protein
MTPREMFWEFAKGFSTATVIFSFAMLILCILATPDDKPVEKFKIVDKYNGCNIIRYTPDSSARYAYFLDCSRVK